MTDLGAAIRTLEPEQVWNGSRWVLIGLFVFALAAVVAGAFFSVTVQLAMAAAFVGALAFGVLARDEVALLCAVLAGFVVIVRYAEGFQVEEAIYGMVYLTYLAYWFISRLFFYRDNILRSKIDWALFLFLIYVTVSLVLTPLLNGEMAAAISEWLSVSMLAFYFPIKETCIRRRDRLPQKPILYSLGGLALFIALRNFVDYRIGLSQADYLWQIATGRVVMNEHVLLMAGIVTLVFLVYARRRLPRAVLGLLFVIYSIGILIGQSRAVWVAFLFGIGIIFLFVGRRERIQIAVLGLLGVSSILVIGMVLFDNFFNILVAGFADRFLSLRSAAIDDVSLINRFVEMGAAWEYIRLNPVVGYGFGVPIDYYSLVYKATRVSSYVHNMYVGVWYRHGLIGLVLLFYFYFGSIWLAFRTVRSRGVKQLDKLIAIAAIAFLVAESIVGNAANSFATSDTTLIIAAVAGLAAASWHRTQNDVHHPDA